LYPGAPEDGGPVAREQEWDHDIQCGGPDGADCAAFHQSVIDRIAIDLGF